MTATGAGVALLSVIGAMGAGVVVHGIWFPSGPNPAFPDPITTSDADDAWVDILRHENYNNPKNFHYQAPDGTIYVRDRREAAIRPADTPWTTQP